jgi:4-amino-4-deoxy-L-arabinose transferase-like glycosyltransferase
LTIAETTPRPTAAWPRLSLEETLLALAIGTFIVAKLVMTFVAFPVLDETYYWMWGRHPALSYFDHPPLEGWLQGLSYAVFGHGRLQLRWMTWAALAVELFIFYRVALRLAGAQWRVVFLRSSAVFLASPLFGVFGTLAFLDYLLVALVMSSGYLFISFFWDVEEGRRGKTWMVLLAGVLLGLAAITKYNGAFLGLAVAGTVLLRPKLRRLLLDWRLWAAAVIAVLIQTPVILWNVQENYASFAFQMGSRHGTTGFQGINVASMKAVAGEALLVASPFFVPIVIRFFWARQAQSFERIGKTLAIWTFWLSSATCLFIANFSWVLFWWNIVAYVLIFPFSGRYTRPVTLGLHVAYGLFVHTFATITYAIVPVLLLFGGNPGMETEGVFGWPEIAAQMQHAREETGATFYGANAFQASSQLAWAMNDPDVAALTVKRDGFDDWWDAEAHKGQSAIILDHPGAEDDWQKSFASVRELGPAPAMVWGHTLRTYTLWYAEGFTGVVP